MKQQEGNQINTLLSETINNNLEDILYDVFESKTFIASMYLLQYIYKKDENAFCLFIEEFRKLDFADQSQVLMNVSTNLQEQKKVKVKKK